MTSELFILSITAASVGFIHTLFGPDHYLPFIVMSKARKWSINKTMWITFFCGLGHVLSSVLLGILGIILGIAIHNLEYFESFRGNLAGWALLVFGLIYMIWGIRKALRNKPHTHWHSHGDMIHEHNHNHHKDHLHLHESSTSHSITPWILFTIFLFGPCEPLIPIFMYPAAKHSLIGVIFVTGIFSLVTISTMISLVYISVRGINLLPINKLEKYTHAIAGFTIFLCGFSIQVLGL